MLIVQRRTTADRGDNNNVLYTCITYDRRSRFRPDLIDPRRRLRTTRYTVRRRARADPIQYEARARSRHQWEPDRGERGPTGPSANYLTVTSPSRPVR